MTEKTLSIGGKEVKMKSSAAIPRLYRIKFKRDVFKDLSKLQTSYDNKEKTGGELQIEDLEIFENLAYMTPVQKAMLHCELARKWSDGFFARPYIRMEWGRGPMEYEYRGRIVGARSAEQSVGVILHCNHS